MNENTLFHPPAVGRERATGNRSMSRLAAYLPAVGAVAGAIVILLLRIEIGGERFISDGALMMLALASYLFAAVFYLTDLYAPFRFADRACLWASIVGVMFNLSSWLVRWVSAYDRELAVFRSQAGGMTEMPWIFRYVPFANLYDLSLAFAFGAGITTLIVIRRREFRAVTMLTLPLAAIVLVLARFIGSELIDLPPVLDSYWRPIHVGVASLSYGIGLVCFAVAVLYLLKDGLEVKKMAVWTSIFAIAVFATISRYSVFAPGTFGRYAASTFMGASRSALPLRADIPYVGWFLVAAGALLAGSLIAYALAPANSAEKRFDWQTLLLRFSLVVQAAGIATLIYQIKTLSGISSLIGDSQYPRFAVWMLEQQGMPQQQIATIGQAQLYQIASKWVAENGSQLSLSLNANPVELAALITAFAGTFFIVLFGVRTERIRALLPSAEVLDGLMYKLAGVTFAGLALLLITGAVWANESWGRYWGWDAKEVGALIAWLTYAGFLHSRIAYGWRGRRSAYFAVIAFLFIIFTYLGVSYLLPGLHSYA